MPKDRARLVPGELLATRFRRTAADQLRARAPRSRATVCLAVAGSAFKRLGAVFLAGDYRYHYDTIRHTGVSDGECAGARS